MTIPTGGRARAPAVGVMEWFVKNEHERVERVVASLRALGVEHLRTGVSWADWLTPGGAEWYAWLLPRLARDFSLLPCVTYTPPSLGVVSSVASPPRRPRDYADFLDVVLDRHGRLFEHVELWNEPNNLSDWDWRIDTDWRTFVEMVAPAANWARVRGKKPVLGGMSPLDPRWLEIIAGHGVLALFDAVGIHGFPGTWEPDWPGWDDCVAAVRAVLDAHAPDTEIWITEVGFSTWARDEHSQLRTLAEALAAPVGRVYWYSAEDLAPSRPTVDGLHADERDYHFGLRTATDEAKLLWRVWHDRGLDGVRRVARLAPAPDGRRHRRRHALVVGGAGFVGTNLADRLLGDGERVLVLDNLSRPGVEGNLLWLRARHGERVSVEPADVRDPTALRRAVAAADVVFQVASPVAASPAAPPRDSRRAGMEGTENLLEELGRLPSPPPLVFTSTSDVYGALTDVELVRDGTRWLPVDPEAQSGVDERQPLDPHTLQSSADAAAEQCVLGAVATHGVPAIVLRLSCIYGPHQQRTDAAGELSEFLLRALQGGPLTIFGDGAQVQDLLFVSDLVDALLLARDNIDSLSGRPANIGGGAGNAVSPLDVVDLIEELLGERPQLHFAPTRPGERSWYVADTTRLRESTGWVPHVGLGEGVELLWQWLARQRATDLLPAAARA